MALQPSPLLRGFEQGADGEDVWNRMMPGEERGPLTLDPQGVALGRQFQAIKAGLEAQQARPIWDQNNPVGTETVRSMGMPRPTTYAGPVGQFIDPATGRMTEQGAARMENPMLGVDTGGIAGAMKMYHGSPHLFDPTPKNPLGEFRDAAIGSGEGNQAFGYGHYLAEKEGVSQSYKKGGDPRDVLNDYLAGIKNFTLQADDPRITPSEIKTGLARHDDAAMRALSTNDKAVGDIVELLRGYDPTSATHTDAALAAYGRLDKVLPPPSKGHMYEVNVHADPEQFLHWDKPLSEQHPDVRDAAHAALMKSGINRTMADYLVNNKAGRDVHSTLTRGEYRPDLMASNEGSAAATQALQEAGIPGIRYLDAGSRGAGEGTHNVVVFDPANMEIIRRYGLAGLMGGGAAALAGGGTQEQ